MNVSSNSLIVPSFNLIKAKITHFWCKVSDKKFAKRPYNISGEIESNFCSFDFFIMVQFEKNKFDVTNFVRFVWIIKNR